MDLSAENRGTVDTIIPMLQAMFQENELTESTLKVVVNENQGDLDKCVDTILDLITDPLEVARKAQMDEAQREIERARQEQVRRLEELERQIQEQEALAQQQKLADAAAQQKQREQQQADELAAKSQSLLDRVTAAAAEASSELEARMDALTRKARSSTSSKKKRLEHEKQLHADFVERAKEEQAELQRLKQQSEAELKAKLEKELSAMRQNHNRDFQVRVEKEVAKRLREVDRRVAERKEAERKDRERAKQLVEEASPVANKPIVELELDAKFAMPGDKIAVKYRYKKGEPSKTDWIGFYKGTRADDSNQYYTQQYTDSQSTGMLSFTVPNKLGVCEFRFYQQGNYNVVARSTPLHVGPRASLEARIEGSTVVVRRKQVSGTPSSWDWVGLYEQDEKDSRNFANQSTYTYLNSEIDATVILKCPKTPGRYEVRFFSSGSGYSPLAISNTLVVDDNNIVSATPRQVNAGDEVTVSADIKSLPEHARHWIAVFLVGETDHHQYIDSYQYIPKWNQPLKIKAPSVAGTYEVRLFERGSYKLIKASSSFEVQESKSN